MTLHLHRSHRADDLVAILADILRAPTSSPFARDAVMVHSRGLERWLSMRLAQHNGICANVWFPQPAEFSRAIIRTVLGEEYDARVWSRDLLRWHVLSALNRMTDAPELKPVGDWLPDAPEGGLQRRRLELAETLAGCFERYALYRPELLADWTDGAERDAWDAALFREVQAACPVPDPATLAQRVAFTLADQPAPAGLPGRVAAFTVGVLPRVQLQILASLARVRDVHMLLIAPSRQWRMGAVAHHPLLESLGAQAAHFDRAIADVAPDAVTPPHPSPEAPPPTLLGTLQSDLLANRAPSAVTATDPSLQVHACAGPKRQLEVLRDVLFELFEDPRLEPRDVLVMAPDIETFAPLIHAVFDDDEPKRIPYSVADRGIRSDNPVAEALLTVLDLADSRLYASDVLDLLAAEPVRARFELAPDELPEIRALLTNAGARWGVDAAHREQEEQPAEEEYTWRYAIDRLLMGQAMYDDEAFLLDVVAAGDVEGKSERAVLSRVVDFLEQLLEHTVALRAPRSLEAWHTELVAVLDSLTGVPPERRWQRQQVVTGLAEWVNGAAAAGITEPMELATVRKLLAGRFSLREPGRGFLTGAVTFCQLVPMRSIPFKVIAMLGMDDGSYPRRGAKRSFDRMASEPRSGDRSMREDDRALFLEAMLATRETLILTYSGQRPSDGREMPPAVPVAELLDVLEAMGAPRERVERRHKLQSFHPAHFDGTGPVQSFDRRHRAAAEAYRVGRRAPEVAPPMHAQVLEPVELGPHVELQDLIKCLKNPLQFFYVRRLGISWYEDEDTVADREAYALDSLEEWAVLERLLGWALAGEDLAKDGPAFDRMRRSGRLPPAMQGASVWLKLVGEAEDIAERVRPLIGEPRPPVDVELPVGGKTLVGRVQRLYRQGHVMYRSGAPRAKHQLEVWLTHLLLCAAGHPMVSHIVGKGKRPHYRWAPIAAREASEHLETFVGLYELAHRAPLLFLPGTSESWYRVTRKIRSDDPWDLFYEASGRVDWPPRFGADPYWAHVFPHKWTKPYHPKANVPIHDGWTFARLAWTITAPLMGGRETG